MLMRVVKPALQDSELQQLDSAGEVKFSHAVGFMDLHRLDDHVQPLRDLLVAISLRTESKNAQLPFGHRRHARLTLMRPTRRETARPRDA